MSNTNLVHDHNSRMNNVNVSSSEPSQSIKVVDDVVRHLFDSVLIKEDIPHEGPNVQEIHDIPENIKSRCKGDTNSPPTSVNFFDLSQDDKSVKNKVDDLVSNIHNLNDELQNICGEKSGLSKFIDKQEQFTKEILDAYITTTTISNDLVLTGAIEQRKGIIDVTKSPHCSQTFVNEDDLEYYPDEQVLFVTSLEDIKTPEYIPLPNDSDDDLKEETLPNKEILDSPPRFVETETVGDTTSENVKNSPSYDFDMKESKSDVIIKTEKKRRSLRSRIWKFFAKNSNDTSRTTRLLQKN